MKEKYLLFYLKTGGGHLAPAKSIANYISQTKNSQIETILIDGLYKAPGFAKYAIEDAYRISQIKAVWTFEFLYALNKIPLLASLNIMIVNYFVKPYLREIIQTHQPSKLVIFHFFLIDAINDILKELNLDIPVTIVVTDPYTAHPIWFRVKNQNYIVFSNRLKLKMLEKGIPSNKINVFPFIVNDRFSQQLDLNQIQNVKTSLGFDRNKRLILILGGGDGMPRGEKILLELLNSKIDSEIALVCGHNKKLHEFATKLKIERKDDRLKIYGFVDIAYELMSISDVVITKCGASTFMEILMTGKIPVINNYIWEQEKGNMEYVRDKKMGIYEYNIPKMVENVALMLTNTELFSAFKVNIKNENLKNGTPDVAEYLINYQF